MASPTATAAEKLSALQGAAASHVKYASECAAARGVDRHLAGLRMVRHATSTGVDVDVGDGYGYGQQAPCDKVQTGNSDHSSP